MSGTQDAIVKLILDHIGGSKIKGANTVIAEGRAVITKASTEVNKISAFIDTVQGDINEIKNKIFQNPVFKDILLATAAITEFANLVNSIPNLSIAHQTQLIDALDLLSLSLHDFQVCTDIQAGVQHLNPFVALEGLSGAITALEAQAIAAAAAAASAEAEILIISSDGYLSKSEKPAVIKDFIVIQNEYASLEARSTALQITTLKITWENAFNSLSTYLNNLSPAYNNVNADTVIIPAVFQQSFVTYYNARQNLIDEMIRVTKLAADQGVLDSAAARADARSALDNLAIIASDNILSANEKPVVIKDYQEIVNEHSIIDGRAASLLISTERTAWNAAYTALGTYLTSLSPAYNDATTNTNIVAATFRQKFLDYYVAREALLDKITAAVKSVADQGVLDAANAQRDATNALAGITVVSSDGVLAPNEKSVIIKDYQEIVNEHSVIDARAAAVIITTERTAWNAAYAALGTYLTSLSPAYNNLTTNTTIDGATFRQKFLDYYNTREILLDKISEVIKQVADQGVLDAGNAHTAATTAINEIVVISSDGYLSANEKPAVIRDYQAIVNEHIVIDTRANSLNITTERNAWNTAYTSLVNYLTGLTPAYNNSTTDTIIDPTVFKNVFVNYYTTRETLLDIITQVVNNTANTGVFNAAQAQLDATSALADITNIVSDGVITPAEKSVIIKDYQSIISEYSVINSRATTLGISAPLTNYQSKYTLLGTYLTSLSPAYTNTTTNTAVDGPTFRQKFIDYYAARETLLDQINQVIKAKADQGVLDAAQAQLNANSALVDIGYIVSDGVITPAEKSVIIKDYNSIVGEYSVINSRANVLAVTSAILSPYQTAYAAIVTYLSSLSPPWNNLTTNTNIDGPTFRQKFVDYYTSRETVLDQINQIIKSRADLGVLNATTAQTQADAAIGQLTQIASDSVLSANEKPAVIADNQAIINEYSIITNRATAVGITTELTSYTGTYNTLQAYLTGLSPAYDNALTNTTIVAATFKNVFVNYYTARETLLDKIAALAAITAVYDNVVGPGKPITYLIASSGNSAINISRAAGLYKGDGTSIQTSYWRSYMVCSMYAPGLWNSRGFDVYGSGAVHYAGTTTDAQNDAAAMAAYLNGLTAGIPVVIYTSDEPKLNRLNAGLDLAMYRCGASPGRYGDTVNFHSRGAYILVGQAGIGQGNGNESLAGSVDNGTDASVVTSAIMINGVFQLVGSAGVRGGDGIPGQNATTIYLTSNLQTISYDSTGTLKPTTQDINFTAFRQHATEAAVFSINHGHNPATFLSGSGDFRTMTASNYEAIRAYNVANFSDNTVTILATLPTAAISDQITIIPVQEGKGGVTGYLTNESVTLGADNSGVVGNYSTAIGNAIVIAGLIDVSAYFNISVGPNTNNLTVVVDNSTKQYQVTGGFNVDNANVTIRMTGTGLYSSNVVDKIFTVAKSKTGPAGNNIPALVLTTDKLGFTFTNQTAVPSSQTITLTAKLTAVAGPITFTTIPASITLNGTGLTRTLALADFGTNRQITIIASDSATGVSDTVALARLDYATGTLAAKDTIVAGDVAFQVGGGNLLHNSGFENSTTLYDGWTAYNNAGAAEPTVYQFPSTGGRIGGNAIEVYCNGITTTGRPKGIYLTGTNANLIRSGVNYVLSFYAKSKVGWNGIGHPMAVTWNSGPSSYTWVAQPLLSYDWQRWIFKFRYEVGATLEPNMFIFMDTIGISGTLFNIDDMQLEEGEVVTGYAPSGNEIRNVAYDAQTNAANATQELVRIASANYLSAGDKPAVIRDYQAIINEQSYYTARSSALGTTTEQTSLNSTYTALTNYIGGLSPAYTDTTQDTVINGTTFDNAFTNYYLARTVLNDRYIAVTKATADASALTAVWPGIPTGNGRPADNADVTNYADTRVNNAAITMSAAGVLSGAGGGTVTLAGVGFTGDSDAQRNNRITMSAAGVLTGAGGGSITALGADNLIDGSTYGRYALTERTKLGGVALNATANQTDATTNSAIATAATTATYAGVSGIPFSQLTQNYFPVQDWIVGSTVNTARVTPNINTGSSTANIVVNANGPTGAIEQCLHMVADASGQKQGGFDTSYFTAARGFDTHAGYRMSIWAYQVSTAVGYLYLGTGGDYGVIVPATGASDTNPYFYNNVLPSLNKWYLIVGHIHAAGSDVQDGGLSGVYDPTTGTRVQGGSDFRIDPRNTYLQMRAYQYYSSSGSDAYFARPMLERIGPNTASIASLMGPAALLNANQLWAQIGGAGKPVDNATANQSDAVTNTAIGTAATTSTWSGTSNRPANLASLAGNESFLNDDLTLSGDGFLRRVGGVSRGQVTIGGLGYTGALNATANQTDATTNTAINVAATTALLSGVSGAGVLAGKNRVQLQAAEGGLANQANDTWLLDAHIVTSQGTAAGSNALGGVSATTTHGNIATAGTTSTWAGTTGAGKAADYATRNQDVSLVYSMVYPDLTTLAADFTVATGTPYIVSTTDSGGSAIQLNGIIQAYTTRFLAYLPQDLYEVRFDVQTDSFTAGDYIYLGVQAVDNAGNNLSGNGGSYCYVATANLEVVGRQTYYGYFRGLAAVTVGGSVGVTANDPANPTTLPAGTVKVRPFMLLGYNTGTSQHVVHSVSLRRVDDLIGVSRGAYNNATLYRRGDNVSSAEGRSFTLIVTTSTGNQPPTTAIGNAYWVLVADIGATGSTGATLYQWNAFADTIDGSLNFTLGNPNGRSFRGIAINQTTATQSTNPALYIWSVYTGPGNFGIVARGGTVVSGLALIQAVSEASWGNAGAYSVESFTGGSYVSWTVGPASASDEQFVGLNDDPTTDDNFASIDYAIYAINGTAYAYENGNNVATLGTYTPNATALQVTYNGAGFIYYSIDGVVKYEHQTAQNLTLYMDTASRGPTAGARVTIKGYGSASSFGAGTFTLVNGNNCSVGPRSVKKSGGGGSWDTGAAHTLESFTAGAIVSHKITNNNVMVGLNDNIINGPYTNYYTRIPYGIHPSANGNLYAYQSGSGTVISASWAVGDLLQVAYDNESVAWFKNGILLYEVTAPPKKTYFGDFSIYTQGYTIENITFASYTAAAVGSFTMINDGGMSIQGTTLKKVSYANGSWDSGAHSVQSFASGAFCSFRPSTLGDSFMVALNVAVNNLADPGYATLAEAIYIAGANFYVFRGGNNFYGPTAFNLGDTFGIVYDNTKVSYLHNGTEFTYSTPGAGITYYLDSSFNNVGAQVDSLAFGPAAARGNIGPQGGQGGPGNPGANAVTIYLTSNRAAVSYDSTGAVSPAAQDIVFTAVRQNATEATTFSIGHGHSPASFLTGSGDTRTMTAGNFNTIRAYNLTNFGDDTVQVIATLPTAGISDYVTINKVQNGLPGNNGNNGTNGYSTIVQGSLDGSTAWHSPVTTGDYYIRVSTDGGTTFGAAILIRGANGATGPTGISAPPVAALNSAGSGQLAPVLIAVGATVTIEAFVNLSAGGTGGTYSLQVQISPASAGSWTAVGAAATGALTTTEPDSLDTGAVTFTNASGANRLYDIRSVSVTRGRTVDLSTAYLRIL